MSGSRGRGSVGADTGEDVQSYWEVGTALSRVSAWHRVCEAPHPGVGLPSHFSPVIRRCKAPSC